MVLKVISMLLMLRCAESAVRKGAIIHTNRLQEGYPLDVVSRITDTEAEMECKPSIGNSSEVIWYYRKTPKDIQYRVKSGNRVFTVQGLKMTMVTRNVATGYYQCVVGDDRSKDISRPALALIADFGKYIKMHAYADPEGKLHLRHERFDIFNFPEFKTHYSLKIQGETVFTVTENFPISPNQKMWGDIFLSYVNDTYEDLCIAIHVQRSGEIHKKVCYDIHLNDKRTPAGVEVFFPPKSVKELHVFFSHTFELFALFTTRAPPDFDYKWTFPNTNVKPDEDYFMYKNKRTGNYVMFNKAGTEHNGKYKCCAFLKDVQQACAEFTILIVYKPEFSTAPDNVSVAVGKDAVFTAQAKNRPPKPYLVWYINGEPFYGPDRGREATENTLTFKNVKRPQDIVNVQCRIVNRYGEAWKSVILYVFEPLKRLSGPGALKFSKDKNEVECGFERDPYDKVVVSWFIEDNKISPSDTRFRYKGVDKEVLVMKAIGEPKDHNKYSCDVKSIEKWEMVPEEETKGVSGELSSDQPGVASAGIIVGPIVGILLLLVGAMIVRRKMGGEDLNLDIEDNEQAEETLAITKKLAGIRKALEKVASEGGDHADEIESLAKLLGELQGELKVIATTPGNLKEKENIGKQIYQLNLDLQQVAKRCSGSEGEKLLQLAKQVDDYGKRVAELAQTRKVVEEKLLSRPVSKGEDANTSAKGLAELARLLKVMSEDPDENMSNVSNMVSRLKEHRNNIDLYSEHEGSVEKNQLKKLGDKLKSYVDDLEELLDDEELDDDDMISFAQKLAQLSKELAIVGNKCDPTSAHKKGKVDHSTDAIEASLKAFRKYEKRLQELAKTPGDHSEEIAKIIEEMREKCQELLDTSRAIGGEEGKKLKELSERLLSKLLTLDKNASAQEIAKLSTMLHEEIDNLADVGKKQREKKTMGKDVSKKGKYGNPTDEIVVTLASFRELEKKLQELASSPGDHSKQMASVKREIMENCSKLLQLAKVIGGEEGKKLEALAEKLIEKFSDLDEDASPKETSMALTLLQSEIGALLNIGIAYDKKKRASITQQIVKGTAVKSESRKQAPEDLIPGNIKRLRSLKAKLRELSSSKGDHSIEINKIREEILVCAQELSRSLPALGGDEAKLLMSIVNDILIEQAAASLTKYSMGADSGSMADAASSLDRAIEGILGVGIAYGKKKLLSPEDQVALVSKQMLDLQRKLVTISKNPTKNSQAEVVELQREFEALCDSMVATSKNLGGSEGRDVAKFAQQLHTMASKLTKLGSKVDSPEFAELIQQILAVINQINDVGRGKKKKFQTGDQLASLVVKLRSTQKELLSLSKAPADNEEEIEKVAVQLGAYAELLKILQSKVDSQEAKNLSALISRLESYGVTLATGGGQCSSSEIADIAKKLLQDISEYDRIAGIQQEKEEEEPEWRFHEEQEDVKEVDNFVDVMHKIKIPTLFH